VGPSLRTFGFRLFFPYAHVYSILLGDAVAYSAYGATDDISRNSLYLQMAIVENNWNFGNLRLDDASTAAFY
jgi:hypothetical protein